MEESAKKAADEYVKENPIKLKDGLDDSNQFNLDSPDYTTVPKSGYSPYDRHFARSLSFHR